MAFNLYLTRVLATLSILSTVIASPAYSVYKNSEYNVTLAINVPSNGTNDLFFHFSAPSTYSYVAFGLGGSMSSSLIFVVYPSSNGQNVTVSPRTASGYSQPSYDSSVQVNILNGSGMQNGMYVVNAHCISCRTWTSGQVDATSQSQSMVYALGTQETSPTIQSDSLSANIKQHSTTNSFAMNMKAATGDPGVPNLQATGQQPTGNSNGTGNTPSGSTDGDAGSGGGESHDFPILIHAILMIACFLFVLPAGYLFLRVFEKVWLHAGMQTFGVVLVIGGVVAGVVCNIQHQRMISYHQVLGVITSLLVLTAFTLGLISHQHFKKHKVSSPLMKFHRMAGPSAVVFGWVTTITGFIFHDRKIYILPYTVLLLAVVIIVGGLAFLMRKRKVRKDTMKTATATNFHVAASYPLPESGTVTAPPGYVPPQGYYNSSVGAGRGGAENVPMQTFSRPFVPPIQTQVHPPQGYGYTQGQQPMYMKKGPEINVRPV